MESGSRAVEAEVRDYTVGFLLDVSGSMLRIFQDIKQNYPDLLKSLDIALGRVQRDARWFSTFRLEFFAHAYGLWLPEHEAVCDLLPLIDRVVETQQLAAETEPLVGRYRAVYEARAGANPQSVAEQVMRFDLSTLRHMTDEQRRAKVRKEIEKYVAVAVGLELRSNAVREAIQAEHESGSEAVSGAEFIRRCGRLLSLLPRLAPMIGGLSPMCTALRASHQRFVSENTHRSGSRQVLVIVSDGRPSDGDAVAAVSQLTSLGVEIVSCLVTTGDVVAPRALYSLVDPTWPPGVKTMFELATPMSVDSPFVRVLIANGWTVTGDAPVRILTQINHSAVIAALLEGLRAFQGEQQPPAAKATKADAVSISLRSRATRLVDRLLQREARVASAPQPAPDWRQLADALIQPDKDVRMAAADALIALQDDSAVDVLVEALSDAEFYIRLRAARALGRLHTPFAVPHLITALGDPDSSVPSNAGEALASLPFDIAIESLVAELNGPNKEDAAYALGKTADPRAVHPLIDVVNRYVSRDYDAYVIAAATALGQLRSPDAVGPLIRLLDSAGNDRVRTAAARSLGQIGDERVIGSLVRVCDDPDLCYGGLFSAPTYVVADALASFGRRAVEPVLQFANRYIARAEQSPWDNDYGPKLKRATLARTLAALADSRTVPLLIRLAARDPYHYQTEWSEGPWRSTYDPYRPSPAREALNALGTQVRDAANQALHDANPKVRDLASDLLAGTKAGP